MPKNVEQYLAKGLDQKTAEYYAAGRRRIVAVEPNDDFTLTFLLVCQRRRHYCIIYIKYNRRCFTCTGI